MDGKAHRGILRPYGVYHAAFVIKRTFAKLKPVLGDDGEGYRRRGLTFMAQHPKKIFSALEDLMELSKSANIFRPLLT